MPDSDRSLASFVSFATVGSMAAAQDLAASTLAGLDGGVAELVAEETLCLICTVAARAAAFGLRDHETMARVASDVLLDLPNTWRDYHVASQMLERRKDAGVSAAAAAAAAAETTAARALYDRLQRKLQFYGAHFPPEAMPGERAIAEKMALWMGRVSPPGLPEMPEARLHRLGLVAVVARHARLIREYAAQSFC